MCDDDGDIDGADMRAMAMFLGGGNDGGVTMMSMMKEHSDIIMEKIREKGERIKQHGGRGLPPLDQKVVSVYRRRDSCKVQVGRHLVP